MFKRVALFLATNLAVLLVLSVVLRLLGVDSVLDERGVGIDYEALLILSLVIGFGGSFISLAMSKWIAKRSTGARVITQPASSALVAVSTGLLRGMPREEVEAVLAHEVSHVANGDMVTLTLVQGVVNTFVIFLSRVVGHFVDRVLLRNESGHGIGYFGAVIAAQLVLGILASVIVMWVSRQREFRADAGSAELNGRQPMINALARLERGAPAEMPESLRAFGISGGKRTMMRLFMSHPPISERIEALQRP